MRRTPMHRANNWRRIFLLNRSTVSAAQKAALARVLASRYRRLCAGELYRIDEWPLPEPTEAVTIDTGLLLIGLYECLGDLDVAETALRDIVVLFLRSLHLPEEARRGIYPKRLDLRHQLAMLELWTNQHGRGPPWEPVLCFAACLLFHGQTEPTTTQIGKALSADAWALYSKTLSFFGRALDDARVVDSSTDKSAAAPGSSMRAA